MQHSREEQPPSRSLNLIPVRAPHAPAILRKPLLPPCPALPWRRKAALALALGGFVVNAGAAPVSIDLSGTTSFDGWHDFTATNLPGVMFPGTNPWPTTGGNWTSFNTGEATVGAINSEIAGSADAIIYKIANGIGGGPYPAGSSMYFGGTSGTPNTEGGTLGIADATPVNALKTIVLQIEIGEATGYDFFNHTLPTLTYTTASGSVTIGAANFSGKIGQVYNGTVPMPTGNEDIYINTWGLQWDLSSVQEPILSIQAQFTGAQHAQLYGVQLNQSDAMHALSVMPRPTAWTAGGANSNWGTHSNWDGNAVPAAGKDITFGSGQGVNLDSNRSAGTANLTVNGNFTISGDSGTTLTLAIGLTATPTAAAGYQVSAPVNFSGFNLLNLNANTDLTFSGGITGRNFYQQGSGTLRLTGNNTFSNTNTFGIIFGGGKTFISGTNTFTDTGVLETWIKKDSVVTLHGGDNRLGSNFAIRFDGGNTIVVEGNDPFDAPGGKLVLGDAAAPSHQTLAGLSTQITTENTRNYVVGGNAQVSILTIQADTENIFTGKLGGNGAHENRLALVKNGTGTLALTNANTFEGGTVLNNGFLQVSQDAALGTGTVTINGGGFRYGAAFNDLRAFNVTSSNFTLDSNGFNVAYGQNLGGTSRFTKTGVGALALTGTNSHTGGTSVTGGLLSIDSDARLGAVPASATPGNLVLNNGGLLAAESLTLDARRGIALGAEAGNGSGQINISAGKTLTYGGVMANQGAGTGALFKLGSGTLKLTGENAYTGTTDAYQGKIQLDFANATTTTNIVNTGSGLRGFGGDVEIVAKPSGTTSQTFASFLTSAGHTNLKADSNGGGGLTLALGAMTRTAGATVNLDLPTTGNVTTTSTTLTNGVLTSVASTGVVFATANHREWLTVSGGIIQPLASYETSANPGDWTATKNVSLTASATGVNGQTVNTLKLQDGADVTMAGGILTLGTGGLLVTGNSGTTDIAGGTLRGSGGTTKELAIFQNNTAGSLNISSVIANNSTATALTKTGEGTLALSGLNTYTGVTRILGGTLEFNSLTAGGTASPIGQAPASPTNIVIDGGTLKYTGPAATSNRGFTLGYQGGTWDASGTGPVTLTATTPVSYSGSFARALTLAGTNTGDNILQIPVNNTGSTGATSIIKDGPGTWVLSPGSSSTGNNQFTGGLSINGGTIKLGRVGALNNTGVNTVAFGPGADTKFALNGYSVTIAGLSSVNGNPLVENGHATPAILTISSGAPSQFSGVVRDGAGGGTLGLTKAGPGTLTLAGVNLYNGPTEVRGGILEIASSGALTGNGNINVQEGAQLVVLGNIGGTGALNLRGGKLKGSGIITRGLTIEAGGILAPGNSPGLLNTGNLLWGQEGILEFELNNATGLAGTHWDFVNVTGTLNITASESNPFVLDLISLNSSNEAGVLENFDPSQNFTWAFASASGGITGFDAGDIVVDTSHFSGALTGTFAVAQSGNDLMVSYHAVPEPSAVSLILCAGSGFLAFRRRRNRH